MIGQLIVEILCQNILHFAKKRTIVLDLMNGQKWVDI